MAEGHKDMPAHLITKRNTACIDFHTHILPGMDDGSDDVTESLAMLDSLADQGVGVVCATSHYYASWEEIDVFAWRRAQAADLLQESLAKRAAEKAEAEKATPEILLGAETAFFPGICESRQLDKLCLQGTSTLLVEMPFTEWNHSQIEEVISLVLDRSYRVVLVHPERFLFGRANIRYMKKLAELPVAMQVNADTLIRWRTRRQGLELLRMTDMPLLGTDCHNMAGRAPHMDRARNVVKNHLGSGFLRQIDDTAGRLATADPEE